jgi:hypothetical protein
MSIPAVITIIVLLFGFQSWVGLRVLAIGLAERRARRRG